MGEHASNNNINVNSVHLIRGFLVLLEVRETMCFSQFGKRMLRMKLKSHASEQGAKGVLVLQHWT